MEILLVLGFQSLYALPCYLYSAIISFSVFASNMVFFLEYEDRQNCQMILQINAFGIWLNIFSPRNNVKYHFLPCSIPNKIAVLAIVKGGIIIESLASTY